MIMFIMRNFLQWNTWKLCKVNNGDLRSHINHIYCTGAALAKPNVFQPADPAVIGVDIFSRLVPLAAHEQSSVYR